MYARVSKIPGNHVEQVSEYLQKSKQERLKKAKGVYVLVDENKKNMMTITLWDSKEQAEATLPEVKEVFKGVEKITGHQVEIEHFEVVWQQ